MSLLLLQHNIMIITHHSICLVFILIIFHLWQYSLKGYSVSSFSAKHDNISATLVVIQNLYAQLLVWLKFYFMLLGMIYI